MRSIRNTLSDMEYMNKIYLVIAIALGSVIGLVAIFIYFFSSLSESIPFISTLIVAGVGASLGSFLTTTKLFTKPKLILEISSGTVESHIYASTLMISNKSILNKANNVKLELILYHVAFNFFNTDMDKRISDRIIQSRTINAIIDLEKLHQDDCVDITVLYGDSNAGTLLFGDLRDLRPTDNTFILDSKQNNIVGKLSIYCDELSPIRRIIEINKEGERHTVNQYRWNENDFFNRLKKTEGFLFDYVTKIACCGQEISSEHQPPDDE